MASEGVNELCTGERGGSCGLSGDCSQETPDETLSSEDSLVLAYMASSSALLVC